MVKWVMIAALTLPAFAQSCGSIGNNSGGGDAPTAQSAPPPTPPSSEAKPAPAPLPPTASTPKSTASANASSTSLIRTAAAVPASRVEYFVDAKAGDDSADGLAATRSGGHGPWRSLGRANQAAAPGVAIRLGPGSYDDAIQPANSGSAAGGYVTYANASATLPTINATIDLKGRSYIRLQGLSVQSPTGSYWLDSDQGSHHFEITGCVFDSRTSHADAFGGINLRGHDHVIRGNSFGRWLGDMIYAIEGVSRLLVENNDFSRAAGEHAILTIVGTDCVIRNNYFTNPLARTLHITWNGSIPTRGIVVENNAFVETAWDRKRPHPASGDDRGSCEALRFLASDSILRNNLILATNAGTGWDIDGALSFQSFQSGSCESRHYEGMRIYHNTIFRNFHNGMTFTANMAPFYANDNKFKDNIIGQSGAYAFCVKEDKVPWKTYRFESNLLSYPGKATPIFLSGSGEAVSLQAAEQNFPGVFQRNILGDPAFASAGVLDNALQHAGQRSLADLGSLFAGFQLASGSPGKGKAAALASVTAAGANVQRISVDDALWFHDGLGVVEGDRVIVGGNAAATVTKVLDKNSLQLDKVVTVKVGDGVFLEKAGSSADIGVYGLR
ncbi:MAG: right-handed parallel beta-helix repeat-containing protein [Planctomycetota bacterium]|nr:right-handed parallel beta-helix repeat-containing protein [Planctomycetota bacterium]